MSQRRERGEVPWRFSEADRRSAWLASSSPASENLHMNGLMHSSNRRCYSITSSAVASNSAARAFMQFARRELRRRK
jgi:hypothetical protein